MYTNIRDGKLTQIKMKQNKSLFLWLLMTGPVLAWQLRSGT